MNSINQRVLGLTLAGLLGSVSSIPAFAAGDLKSYDVNGDGKVSAKEFQSKGGSEGEFRAMDANGDGNLTSSEFDKGSKGSGSGSGSGSSSMPPAPAPGGPTSPGGL